MTNPIDAALAALDAAGVDVRLKLPLRKTTQKGGQYFTHISDSDNPPQIILRDVLEPEADLLIAAVNALPDVRRMREELEWRESSCPCVWTEPCHRRCTCVNPVSSRGCSRCCTYGSEEQRKDKAAHIVSEVSQLRERVSDLERERDHHAEAAGNYEMELFLISEQGDEHSKAIARAALAPAPPDSACEHEWHYRAQRMVQADGKLLQECTRCSETRWVEPAPAKENTNE